MAIYCVVHGSFRKYPDLIQEVCASLRHAGVEILAPKASMITSFDGGFALFAGEAQMRAQAQAALTDRPSGQIDPLYLHIDELELSARTSNVFQNHRSIRFVGELVQKSEDELLRIKYLGRHALKEVNRILEKLGLSLATRLSPDVFNPAKAEADWDARRQRPVDQC